jgi:hypothetical protein
VAHAAKSKFSSEAVGRVQTLKFQSTAAGIKLTSDGTDAQGKVMHGAVQLCEEGEHVRV